MTNYSDYINYFQLLASQHTEIQHSDKQKHFFRTTLEEVLTGIGNKTIRYPALLLLPLEIRKQGNIDNRSEKIFGGFLILEALKDVQNLDKREAILDRTRSIGEDILLKIEHDVDVCEPYAQKVFYEFDFQTAVSKEWGPVWDNCYGWSYEFPITSEYTKTFNPEKWLQ